MRFIKPLFCLLLAILLPRFAQADLVGPYTVDANTLYLFHFNEAAGGSTISNAGNKGGVSYAINENPASATPPLVTTMLGATAYSTSLPTSISFGTCMTNPTAVASGGFEFGYDFNKSGAYDGDTAAAALSADSMAMTNFNIGNGGQTPFTIEALIQPSSTAGSQEIVCTDSSAAANANRGFQFRINSGTFQLQFIGGPSPRAISGTIPTTGSDAFVPGAWYHVAATYDGTTMRLYWTRLDPSVGAAHLLNSGAISLGTVEGAVVGPLIIGDENRNVAGEQFLGSIDEVRISSVARAANQMQFFSATVSITQNPVSQNIDYNQLVTFSVGASSTTALGYRWRFNSNSIAGGTNASYVITNVAAANAGYYDVVVTNQTGSSSTSSPALLVVGAANFLNHRYSFTSDASDSIGGANGTLLGDANVAGGQLVLDGVAGTYMQLPSNLFTAANSTALTVEFWASFGVNGNFVRVFDFGNTNVQNNGVNYVGFSPHNGSGGNQIHISPGDGTFQQQVTSPGTFDNLSRHVACVIDPPNQTLAIYTNGVLEAVITNMTVGIPNLNDTLSYIGHSLFAADPYLVANIDELRLYNGALSSISIKQSDDQGPNTVLADGPAKFVILPVNTATPVGQPATFTVATVGYLPITYQWFKNGTLVPGATNNSYSFNTTLGDNNASIVAYATNSIGITTYITNSPAVTLTVFTPPTLAWLDAANGGADNSWNTTSLDWTNNVNSIVAFAQTNGVVFDSRGSGSPSVDIGGAIVPYNITVNASSDYTFSSSTTTGSLNGQGSLTKLNSGTLTIDVTNNMTGSTTISGGKLQIGNFDSVGTLGGGPVTNNGTLSFTRSDTVLAVPNAIHGSGSVSCDGAGVTLSGANDYTGSTVVNSGILFLQNGSGLGATSGGTLVANGGQLYITVNANIGLEGLTLNGAGDGNGALRKGGAGATTYNGHITLASDSTIGLDGGATLTLSNSVSGAAALTVNGTGTLVLTTPNGYTGGTTLSGPVVNLNASGALGTGLVTVNGAGRFVLADGLNFTNSVTASVISPGASTGLLMVNDNTNGIITTISGPLELDASAATGGDFQGPITSGYLNVLSPVTNTGSGVVSSRNGFVRFSGGGSYGQFNLNQGTASLGANNGLSTSAFLSIAASGAATFDLNGFNQSLIGISDGATNPELITNSSASPATLSLDLSVTYTYNGVIGGNLALVVNGTGNLALLGTNTYTGNTTVTGGLLEIAQPGLAAGSTVSVASGATLQLDFTATNIVAGLVLNGAAQPAGIYNNTTSPSYIIGSGYLLVNPVATNPTNIIAKLNGNTLNLSWPADHKGWRLLVQTNNLAKGVSINPSDYATVAGSAATNQVDIVVDPAKPAEFYLLTYP